MRACATGARRRGSARIGDNKAVQRLADDRHDIFRIAQEQTFDQQKSNPPPFLAIPQIDDEDKILHRIRCQDRKKAYHQRKAFFFCLSLKGESYLTNFPPNPSLFHVLQKKIRNDGIIRNCNIV